MAISFSLEGQVALVTDVGRGIGAGIAQSLARPGASVRHAGKWDRSTSWMISIFSAAGYLIRRRPHPRSCFFLSSRSSSVCSASTSFRSRFSRRRTLTSSVVAACPVSPASRFLPASRNSFDQL